MHIRLKASYKKISASLDLRFNETMAIELSVVRFDFIERLLLYKCNDFKIFNLPIMEKDMYLKLDASFANNKVILWSNLSRLNTVLIILNISMFFLSGLVAQGYFYTFFSISCCGVVAILTILPVTLINRLWYYLLNLLFEFVGIYFFLASIIYWVNTGAQLGP